MQNCSHLHCQTMLSCITHIIIDIDRMYIAELEEGCFAMIIAVSDLHLGDLASNRTGFLSFIEDFLKPKCDEITDLVLLGDILDLWRRNCSRVILDNLDILNDVCSLGFHIHYIVGNHDFIMKQFGAGGEDKVHFA